MDQNKVLLILFVACWLCSITVEGVSAPEGLLQSHMTDGFPEMSIRTSKSHPDCNRFENDYDVLYHLPFEILINPINNHSQRSMAIMNENSPVVTELQLRNEKVVPWSIFCLKNLGFLEIQNTPFLDGVVPDHLENLEELYHLHIDNSTIVKMTKRLGTLISLQYLSLQRCSLTSLPNLGDLSQLRYVALDHNRLSKLNGLTAVYDLQLNNNLFTDVPTLKIPNSLTNLNMDQNPLKDMLSITSHINLQVLSLINTTLSFIPPMIDRLQQLQSLYLSNNKLIYLPTNILNLPHLKLLDIRNNSFTFDDIQTIVARFNRSRPILTVDY